MERTDFIIYIDQIPPQGIERRLELSSEVARGLRLAVPLDGPLTVDLTLTRHGRKALVRGAIEGRLLLDCSRCLKAFPHPFSSSFDTYLEPASRDEEEPDRELSREELDVQPLQGGAVDLREIIAEQVHVAVPYKALCGESCKGMCSRCGVDLNSGACSCGEKGTDPRWDALKDLKVH